MSLELLDVELKGILVNCIDMMMVKGLSELHTINLNICVCEFCVKPKSTITVVNNDIQFWKVLWLSYFDLMNSWNYTRYFGKKLCYLKLWMECLITRRCRSWCMPSNACTVMT